MHNAECVFYKGETTAVACFGNKVNKNKTCLSVCPSLHSFFMECSILHVHDMITTLILINQIVSSTRLSIDRLQILQGISDWQGLSEMHRHGSWETAGKDAGLALLQLRQRINKQ